MAQTELWRRPDDNDGAAEPRSTTSSHSYFPLTDPAVRARSPARNGGTYQHGRISAADSLAAEGFRFHQIERLRGRERIRKTIAVVYICFAAIYLTWRATVFNPDAPLFSLAFYLAEVLGFVLAGFMIVISWRYRIREIRPAPNGLTVDVFVPTYNESVEMVRRTTLAAINIRYPHETWLLDDGNRPEMKALAAELGCHYLARASNVGAKPGNLNNALKHATGDFIAVMDADFVAQRNFLDRTLGHFTDPRVAFVQCPQDYYNISAFQYRGESRERYLWHDEAPFYQVLQPGRDYWNAASSCGTSVVYRRSALDAVGGFAPETVTEDMHTALRLHMRGFESVYHPESLAYGVAPTDFAEYQKTRYRWGQGNIQGLRCERMPFAPRLSLMQRLCYMQFGVMHLEGWQRMVLYLTPVIVLIADIYPVTNTGAFFWFFIPYLLIDYLCYEETMRGYGRVYLNEQLCMSRFPIYIMATFAIFFDYVRWRVSSKKISGDLPIWLVFPQVAILALSVIAIGFGLHRMTAVENPAVPAWITGIVCLFALAYAALAFLVIVEARRRARWKRPDFRFDIPFPVRIDSGFSVPVVGVVSAISTTGMQFVVPGQHPTPSSDTFKGAIYLPDGELPFEASLESREWAAPALRRGAIEDRISVLFAWPDIGLRDRLDQTLHACGWHRRFAPRHEYLTTPLEWLQQRIFGGPSHETLPDWKTILYRRLGDPEGRLHFGFCSGGDGNGCGRRLTAFRDLAVGDRIEVVDPRKEAGRQRMTVLARGRTPDSSEIELAGAVPVVYAVAAGQSMMLPETSSALFV